MASHHRSEIDMHEIFLISKPDPLGFLMMKFFIFIGLLQKIKLFLKKVRF